MSFNINKKLFFIDNFQFLGSALNSLVKNLGEKDFNYLSQNFDTNVLDLVKQKWFYPYEYINDFEMFKEEFASKEKLYSLLTGKKNSNVKYEHVLNVWNTFQMKKMKDYNEF